MAARVGSHEREQEALEPVWQHAETRALQRHAKYQPLLVVKLGRPARFNCVDERLNDRVAAADRLERPEQRVLLVLADLDDCSCYVDLYALQTAARLHGLESTT